MGIMKCLIKHVLNPRKVSCWRLLLPDQGVGSRLNAEGRAARSAGHGPQATWVLVRNRNSWAPPHLLHQNVLGTRLRNLPMNKTCK